MNDHRLADPASAQCAKPNFKLSVLSSLVLMFVVLVFVCLGLGVRGVWRQYLETKGDEGILDFIPSLAMLVLAAIAFAAVAAAAFRAAARGGPNARQTILLATVPATVVISVAIVGSSAKRSTAIVALLVGLVGICVAITLVVFLTHRTTPPLNSRSENREVR